MLFLCYSVVTYLEKIKLANKIVALTSYIGKHTLFIFMFHLFWLSKVSQWSFFKADIWIMRFGYFFVMIFGSILIELAYNKFRALITAKEQ